MMAEAWPQVKNGYNPSLQGKKQPKPDTAGDAQVQKINGVIMFGSAAREMTKNKSSLPALQELDKPPGSGWKSSKNQEKAKSLVLKKDNSICDARPRAEVRRVYARWKKICQLENETETQTQEKTEVLDVSEFLRKKILKEPRKNKQLINIQGKTSYKLTKEPVGKTGTPVMEDCCGFYLEKRQQSSSAVNNLCKTQVKQALQTRWLRKRDARERKIDLWCTRIIHSQYPALCTVRKCLEKIV